MGEVQAGLDIVLWVYSRYVVACVSAIYRSLYGASLRTLFYIFCPTAEHRDHVQAANDLESLPGSWA